MERRKGALDESANCSTSLTGRGRAIPGIVLRSPHSDASASGSEEGERATPRAGGQIDSLGRIGSAAYDTDALVDRDEQS